jgi:hypothetical protein
VRRRQQHGKHTRKQQQEQYRPVMSAQNSHRQQYASFLRGSGTITSPRRPCTPPRDRRAAA